MAATAPVSPVPLASLPPALTALAGAAILRVGIFFYAVALRATAGPFSREKPALLLVSRGSLFVCDAETGKVKRLVRLLELQRPVRVATVRGRGSASPVAAVLLPVAAEPDVFLRFAGPGGSSGGSDALATPVARAINGADGNPATSGRRFVETLVALHAAAAGPTDAPLEVVEDAALAPAALRATASLRSPRDGSGSGRASSPSAGADALLRKLSSPLLSPRGQPSAARGFAAMDRSGPVPLPPALAGRSPPRSPVPSMGSPEGTQDTSDGSIANTDNNNHSTANNNGSSNHNRNTSTINGNNGSNGGTCSDLELTGGSGSVGSFSLASPPPPRVAAAGHPRGEQSASPASPATPASLALQDSFFSVDAAAAAAAAPPAPTARRPSEAAPLVSQPAASVAQPAPLVAPAAAVPAHLAAPAAAPPSVPTAAEPPVSPPGTAIEQRPVPTAPAAGDGAATAAEAAATARVAALEAIVERQAAALEKLQDDVRRAEAAAERAAAAAAERSAVAPPERRGGSGEGDGGAASAALRERVVAAEARAEALERALAWTAAPLPRDGPAFEKFRVGTAAAAAATNGPCGGRALGRVTREELRAHFLADL